MLRARRHAGSRHRKCAKEPGVFGKSFCGAVTGFKREGKRPGLTLISWTTPSRRIRPIEPSLVPGGRRFHRLEHSIRRVIRADAYPIHEIRGNFHRIRIVVERRFDWK